MTNFDFYTIMSIAFLSSFSHCVGMCGGIVIAYSSTKFTPSTPLGSTLLMHILYSLGRTSSYAFLGALFGALGAIIAVSQFWRGILFNITGLGMIFIGLALAFFPRILALFELSINTSSTFSLLFRKLLHSSSPLSFYALGILNGFLPCGLVYFFAINAASSASILHGALSMGAFGLATIPALLLLALATNIINQSAFRTWAMKFSALLIVLFGIYTLLKGYYLIIDPSGANTPPFFGCELC